MRDRETDVERKRNRYWETKVRALRQICIKTHEWKGTENTKLRDTNAENQDTENTKLRNAGNARQIETHR